jgi:DnaD/phage-associated family protein
MALEYWPCYHSYRKKCEKLTDQELGRLVRSLMIYSETGERQELAGRESIAFDFIADDIDRAKDKYDARCEQNRENRNQRTSTTVNERQRTSTNDDESDQSKTKSKSKDKTKSEINTPVPTAHAREEPDLGRVMSFFLDRINPAPSPTCIDLLKQYTASLSADVVIHALEIAIDERKTAWSYIQAILSQYERDGIRDMDGVKRREQERQQRRETAAPLARRMNKSEEFAAAGRNHERTPGEMDKLLAGLDKI